MFKTCGAQSGDEELATTFRMDLKSKSAQDSLGILHICCKGII